MRAIPYISNLARYGIIKKRSLTGKTMPFSIIPFLLLVIPIVEIGAFILVGEQIGLWPTLLMILVTAVIGSFLLRVQGLSLINKVQTEVAAGKVPGKELGHGVMIVVAGIFLLTPGFVTDSIGFLLFVPLVRSMIWGFVASRITVKMPGGGFGGGENSHNPYRDPSPEFEKDGPVIDLDEEDYKQSKPSKDSPWRDQD